MPNPRYSAGDIVKAKKKIVFRSDAFEVARGETGVVQGAGEHEIRVAWPTDQNRTYRRTDPANLTVAEQAPRTRLNAGDRVRSRCERNYSDGFSVAPGDTGTLQGPANRIARVRWDHDRPSRSRRISRGCLDKI